MNQRALQGDRCLHTDGSSLKTPSLLLLSPLLFIDGLQRELILGSNDGKEILEEGEDPGMIFFSRNFKLPHFSLPGAKCCWRFCLLCTSG